MKLFVFLREIRVEHTLFALPFAYVGAIIGARGMPTWPQLMWITLAVLGARTAAMAANRYFDREIDGRNPRTARRALPAGTLAPSTMLVAIGVGLAILLLSAWELNPLCLRLLPIAALGVIAYPLCKRFTWMTHFVLGAVDGLAPLGAFIAITGRIDAVAVALFIAVTVWVAGFDILYALMDLPIDIEQGIHSLPARFGKQGGSRLALWLHIVMLGALELVGYLSGAALGRYHIGMGAALVLFAYEAYLMASTKNLFVLNERVFVANMAFSVVFLGTTFTAFALR